MAKNGKNRKKTDKSKKANPLMKDRRFKILLGILISVFALYLTIGMVSYLFTWKTDQSFLNDRVFSSPEIRVENWSGKAGAWLADFLINRGFGLASFSIPFIFMFLGFRLLNVKIEKLFRKTITTLVVSIYLSILLGYIFGGFHNILGSGPGGRHGLYVAQWLNAFMGKAGTAFFLLITLFAIVIFTNHHALEWIKQQAAKIFRLKYQTPVHDNVSDEPEIPAEEKNTLLSGPDDDLVFETEFPQPELDIKNPLGDLVTELQDSPEEEEIELETMPFTDNDAEIGSENTVLEDYDPTLELSSYRLPTIDLLEKHDEGNSSVTNEELISNKNKIVETLAHYKIQIDKIKATIGPTVTLYEIVPAPGVRIARIKNLEDDIALSLAALGIRIIAPIPGKGTIGIEVPNQKPEIVSMRSILSSRKFQESEYELAIAIGKTISNETYVFDLAKMPHLLIAGATGQGKSVGLNAIITSLLYKKHPSELKFVLVDPKKVELTLYSKLEKHFLAKIPDAEEPIITDTQKVIYTLNSLTIEMDQRYMLLKSAQVRNIKEYNHKFIKRRLNPEKGHRYLPYIVVIIDEFADLIMTAGREVETPLARLAQVARAIGIHLVIATQRPTTNIITGSIKANFPARIAFRVTSMIDSRTILDSPGANQLVGRGDMLLAPGSDMIRLQCAFIDIPEIEKITEYINIQRGFITPFYLPEYTAEGDPDALDVDLSKRDPMFDDAARLVVTHQSGSTSLLQRKFSIGYNRAGKIMDQLEAAGIVGPPDGSKPRQVLYPEITSLEHYLQSLNN
ncbi:MAG: DNA translocase FtsK [Bacteroidales bacterium]|nr:DNA translocase FtsK [Bacteroidales bacterium]